MTRSSKWIAASACFAIAAWAASQQPLTAQKAGRANRLIETLEAGKPALTGDTWVFIDREHKDWDVPEIRATVGRLLKDSAAHGKPRLAPIVRIPAEGDENGRWMIKQVLQLGAMGIIVPKVETAAQVLAIAQGVRHPQLKGTKFPTPVGLRGGSGAQFWGPSHGDDDSWPLNPAGELAVFPMIETVEGVKNVNAMLDVPGITGVLVGPGDLSSSHGERWNGPDPHPDTSAAVDKVARACVAKKKHCAMVTWDEAQTKKYLSDGFKVIFGTYMKDSSL